MRVAILIVAMAACGPKYDPAGPGALPAVVDESSGPHPTAAQTSPRAAPIDEEGDDAPSNVGGGGANGGAANGSADKPPPHATATLTPAKGSKITATLSFVQADDDTHVVGTVTNLAKGASYMLSKRDHCGAAKADDDSRRSNPVVYGVSLKADAQGAASVDDSAKAIHLDGPLAIVGAYFVVSKTAGSAELACGRVVAQ